MPWLMAAVAVSTAMFLLSSMLVFAEMAADTTASQTLSALQSVAQMLSQQASALAQPLPATAGTSGAAAAHEEHVALTVDPAGQQRVDGEILVGGHSQEAAQSAAGNGLPNGQDKGVSGDGVKTEHYEGRLGQLPDGAGSPDAAAQQLHKEELASFALWGAIVGTKTLNLVTFVEPGWWRWSAIVPAWVRPRWVGGCGEGGGGGQVRCAGGRPGGSLRQFPGAHWWVVHWLTAAGAARCRGGGN